MRIAIPNVPAPDTFADNVTAALRDMGHQVLHPHAPLSAAWLDRWRRRARYAATSIGLPESGLLVDWRERWLVKTVQVQRVDMVLALTQQLTAETLRALKRAGVAHLVAWWGDAPANMRAWGLLEDGWDLLCFKDAEAVAKAKRVGFSSLHLHEAMNPAWHKVVARQSNASVVVAGNWYGYRQRLVKRLMTSGVEVRMFGPAIPAWGDKELRRQHTGEYITKVDKSHAFGEGAACLNSTQFAEGNSLNCRAFEIAGAAGLQLIEQRPVVAECFEPGSELLTYDSFEELLAHVDKARRFPGEVVAIREAGSRRAHAEHTYHLRLRRMFRELGIKEG